MRSQRVLIEDPHINAVRAALQRYLDRTGLTREDFARRIGYSTTTLNFFMQGCYEGNPKHICAASKDFMGLHPIAPPNAVEGKLYETENVRAWRDVFSECLDRGRAAVVYGPPGIQKSYPVEHLIAELNRSDSPRTPAAALTTFIAPARFAPTSC
jgi:DNA transposition AAA+ family ATPase